MDQFVRSVVGRLQTLPHLLPPPKHLRSELAIVTGADSSHFKSLAQFLDSLREHEPGTRTIVFDLGFGPEERQSLLRRFPGVDLRIFDYAKYPDYFNIKVNAGEYAWKPVIFGQIFDELKCCLCWMDAGNVVTGSLFWIRRITQRLGMYSPTSIGSIAEWTHPAMLSYLDAPASLLNKPNLNAACVAMSYQNPKARRVVEQWRDGALVKDCIAPQGSSRKNHRQDQSLLSVLAHRAGLADKLPTGLYGFRTHQDIDL